jgi:hypothetical protein
MSEIIVILGADGIVAPGLVGSLPLLSHRQPPNYTPKSPIHVHDALRPCSPLSKHTVDECQKGKRVLVYKLSLALVLVMLISLVTL